MTANKEIITVAVGQCGNQLSRAFWEQKLSDSKDIENDEVFFRKEWSGTKARALLIDTEPRVIDGTLRSVQGEYFDEESQILKRSSGAGNNFAHGYHGYGNHFCDTLIEMFRCQLEACDCPESVMFMHSLGGGTGSGLGTRTVKEFSDYVPKLNYVATSILSSTSAREVITSPYNELLALKQLSDHASVVLPVDNDKLAGLLQSSSRTKRFGWQENQGNLKNNNKAEDGYRSMNDTVVQLLSDLTSTSGMSLSGGEQSSYLWHLQKSLTTPDRRFLTTSTTIPSNNQTNKYSQYAPIGRHDIEVSRRLLTNILDRKNSWLSHRDDIRTYSFTSNLFLCRGACSESYSAYYDTIMDRWKCTSLDFVKGREESDSAMSCFSNCSAISETFQSIYNDSTKLYKKKAMLHHYLEYCEEDIFDEAFISLQRNIDSYTDHQKRNAQSASQTAVVVETRPKTTRESTRPANDRSKSVVTQQYMRKYRSSSSKARR